MPMSVATRFPSYVSAKRATELDSDESVVGLILQSRSGKRLGFFPVVEYLDQNLLHLPDAGSVLGQGRALDDHLQLEWA